MAEKKETFSKPSIAEIWVMLNCSVFNRSSAFSIFLRLAYCRIPTPVSRLSAEGNYIYFESRHSLDNIPDWEYQMDYCFYLALNAEGIDEIKPSQLGDRYRMKSYYILADKEDVIHTTFTQDVTATGRLSSVNPNLQNIPVRTEIGKEIRKGFVARPGKIFVSADYAQFELRLAAF